MHSPAGDRRALAVIATFLLASCATVPTRHPLRVESERPLAPAEQALVNALRESVGEGEVDHEWIAHVGGTPVKLAEGWTLEVQSGCAHAGVLDFRRIALAGKTADIEWIEGEGSSVTREAPLTTTVRRATIPRAEIDALLLPCAALATVSVERRRIPDAPSAGAGSISIDTYLLVRLRNAGGRVVVERHVVGYPGSSTIERLTPLWAATEDLLPYVEGIPSWTTVPESELRGCHLTTAFDANRKVMTGKFAWFVEERSLEMLAQAGNKDAIPTLEWLAARSESDRRGAKIRTLLADPDRWLAGPPRDLAE